MKKILCSSCFLLIVLFFSIIIDCHAQTGIINTGRNSPFGIISYGSLVTNVDLGVNKYVNGYIKKAGSTPFVFPVGDIGRLRPFSASGDGTFGAYFFANPAVAVIANPQTPGENYGPLPSGAPFNINLKSEEVATVSTKEYWDINGTNPTKITLSWDSNSEFTTLFSGIELSKIFIVGWDGAKWVKIPSVVDQNSITGGLSTMSSGSLTTASAIIPNNYNVYSFGASDGPLPVNLVNFNVSEREGTSHLKWSTSSEINSDYFLVEHKSKYTTWEDLGRVISKSDSLVSTTYEFFHKSPSMGENLYRLKMVDKDGSFAYSRIVVMDFDYGDDNITSVFPNPASSRIYMKSISNTSVKNTILLDLTGRTHYNGQITPDGLDISSFPKGIYVLKILYSNGVNSVHRILIN